ncbi:MAG: response regulator transcription factor [Actinomycetota bacterium]
MAALHRVLILDPQPIVRGVVRTACEATGTLTIVAEVGDLPSALAACVRHWPDVLVVDPDPPSGDPGTVGTRRLAAVLDLRAARPGAPTLVLAQRMSGPLVFACLRAKIEGCIAKSAGIRAIVDAVVAVASGGRAFSPDYEQEVIAELGRFARAARTERWAAETLTDRELAVLRLLAEGGTIRKAASALGISPRTVEGHVTRLYRKLGVRTRVEAFARAAALGLIDLARPDDEHGAR